MRRAKRREAVALFQRARALQSEGRPTAERYDDAIAGYRRALELAPDYAQAHGNLGSALREVGDLDGAYEHLKRAIDIDPRFGRFHRLLLDVRPFPVEPSHVRQMERLLGQSNALAVDDRIELHFALARACESLEDYKRSFRNLRDGNALKRSIVGYDEAEELRFFEETMQAFGRPLFQAAKDCGYPSPTPVFIFGMPRSGTTLVEQILAGHPNVYAGGELGAFKISTQWFSIDADPRDVPLFARRMAEQFRALGERCAVPLESLSPHSARITDKWPWTFKFAGAVHLALPRARMIHVGRDPLDTCFSCFATPFAKDLPYMCDLGELGRYYRGYQRPMAHWRDVLPADAILEVRYEELVDDYENQARRVVERCGLQWNDGCSDFSLAKRPIRTASAAAVRQPLYRRSIGRARPYWEFLAPLRAELDR
jgi:hypothetical protein